MAIRARHVRWVFNAACAWGVLSLVPLLFLESAISRAAGSPITHPEYFYGFVGLALAFQPVFAFIARNPVPLRPLMLVSILEKAAFAVPATLLVALGRSGPSILFFAATDACLGVLFAWAYIATRPLSVPSADAGGGAHTVR